MKDAVIYDGFLARADCQRRVSPVQPPLEIITGNRTLNKVFHQVIPPIVMPVPP